MPIACVGISHHTAPVAVRERLALSRDEACSLLASALRAAPPSAGIVELSVVSTCGRTEIYAAAADPAFRFSRAPDLLATLLVQGRGIDPASIRPALYEHASTAALRHLCRVSAGLDSMILGEAEVLGQVAAAHEWAVEAGASGPILGAAFRSAVRAGRRARAETGICRHPLSAATEAVRLLREHVAPGASVLIVGTGDLARLLGEVLREAGFGRLQVIGRALERARTVAAGMRAEAWPWHALPEALQQADVVLTSTAAPHAVITEEVVASVLGTRAPGRQLVFIDLAVPRDVAAGVRALPGVTVHDIDALQQRLDGNLEARRQEVPRVEAIVEEEVAQFHAWRQGAELRPILAAMHGRAEEIRKRETERALARLAGRDPEVYRQIDALSRALVAKLLHEPSARLRSEQDPVRSRTYAGAVRDLFGLELPDGVADTGAGAG